MMRKEVGLESSLYFFVLDTNGAVVEWALTIWEIVRGRK